MTQLHDLPQGGQAAQAWAKPPRSKAQRRDHVLQLLDTRNKLWIATASADGSAHLVPFSFVWDGQTGDHGDTAGQSSCALDEGSCGGLDRVR